MSAADSPNKRWWLAPALFALFFAAALVTAWLSSEIAREVLAKAIFNIVGAVSTPFILEITFALLGLLILLTYNQWRLMKEGDGWVYLAQTQPDPASLATGADSPPHRLDPVVLSEKPDTSADLQARITTVEGYLELGLKKEALDHLRQFPREEQSLPSVRALIHAAEQP